MSPNRGDRASKHQILTNALVNAGRALSTLTGAGFVPHDVQLTQCELGDLPLLFGSETELMAASFFEVRGGLEGFLLLLVPKSGLQTLLDHLLGDGPYEGDMVDSALGELGNIVGSAFLNHLADTYEISASPTPPQVVHDMAGALLNTLAAGLAAENFLTPDIVRAQFANPEEEGAIDAFLLWLPREGELDPLAGLA